MNAQRTVVDRGGRHYRLRPIQAADAPALQRAMRRMDPRDVRARLFAPTTELSDAAAEAFCTIDPARDLCLVIEDPDAAGALLGGCRLMRDRQDAATAEFAVTLLSEMKGQGLGRALMQTLLDEATERGIATVWGTILRDNRAMIELCRKLGFSIMSDPDDASLVRAMWQAPAA